MVKYQDIGQNNGNLKRKSLICIILFFCVIGRSRNQELDNQNLNSILDKENIKNVCTDFIKKYADTIDSRFNKHVILVDCSTVDSVDNYVITENFEIDDLYCKRPNIYFYSEDKLVFVYTKDYSVQKDTIGYRRLLEEAYKYYGVKNSKNYVDTILRDSTLKFTISSDTVFIPGNIHFKIINYKVKNRKILNKKVVNRMLYNCEASERFYYNPRKKPMNFDKAPNP